MQVRDIMTSDPACCAPDANLEDVAKMMANRDCGEIPVVDDQSRLAGVVTDRDIVCRAVAEGRNPQQTAARDVMTSPVITVTEDAGIVECCEQMEQHQIRRVPVVDASGRISGMVAQADIARLGSEHETAELVRDVSRPSQEPAQVSPM